MEPFGLVVPSLRRTLSFSGQLDITRFEYLDLMPNHTLRPFFRFSFIVLRLSPIVDSTSQYTHYCIKFPRFGPVDEVPRFRASVPLPSPNPIPGLLLLFLTFTHSISPWPVAECRMKRARRSLLLVSVRVGRLCLELPFGYVCMGLFTSFLLESTSFLHKSHCRFDSLCAR